PDPRLDRAETAGRASCERPPELTRIDALVGSGGAQGAVGPGLERGPRGELAPGARLDGRRQDLQRPTLFVHRARYPDQLLHEARGEVLLPALVGARPAHRHALFGGAERQEEEERLLRESIR